MSEISKRQCKVCDKEVARILKGKYPDGKNKKWVDSFEREWNGKTCPSCHAESVKRAMKKAREWNV